MTPIKIRIDRESVLTFYAILRYGLQAIDKPKRRAIRQSGEESIVRKQNALLLEMFATIYWNDRTVDPGCFIFAE